MIQTKFMRLNRSVERERWLHEWLAWCKRLYLQTCHINTNGVCVSERKHAALSLWSSCKPLFMQTEKSKGLWFQRFQINHCNFLNLLCHPLTTLKKKPRHHPSLSLFFWTLSLLVRLLGHATTTWWKHLSRTKCAWQKLQHTRVHI